MRIESKRRGPRLKSLDAIGITDEESAVAWAEFQSNLRSAKAHDQFEKGNDLAGYGQEMALEVYLAITILHPELKTRVVREMNDEELLAAAQRSLDDGNPSLPGKLIGLRPELKKRLTLNESVWNHVKRALDDFPEYDHAISLTQHDDEAILALFQLFPDKKQEISVYRAKLEKKIKTDKQRGNVASFVRRAAVATLLFPDMKLEMQAQLAELKGSQQGSIQAKSLLSLAREKIIEDAIVLGPEGMLDIRPRPTEFSKKHPLPERSI